MSYLIEPLKKFLSLRDEPVEKIFGYGDYGVYL